MLAQSTSLRRDLKVTMWQSHDWRIRQIQPELVVAQCSCGLTQPGRLTTEARQVIQDHLDHWSKLLWGRPGGPPERAGDAAC